MADWTQDRAVFRSKYYTAEVARPAFTIELYGNTDIHPSMGEVLDVWLGLVPPDRHASLHTMDSGVSFQPFTSRRQRRLRNLLTPQSLSRKGLTAMIKDCEEFAVHQYNLSLSMRVGVNAVILSLPLSLGETPADAQALFTRLLQTAPFTHGTAGYGYEISFGGNMWRRLSSSPSSRACATTG